LILKSLCVYVYETAVMSEIINRELGGPKAVAEHFEYINPEPLASASIAQVQTYIFICTLQLMTHPTDSAHRAVLNWGIDTHMTYTHMCIMPYSRWGVFVSAVGC
jgi:hypothetical protein